VTALALRLHRVRGGWRCKVGIHRWRGHMDCGDGVNVAPWNQRLPCRGAWRVCDWCGAQAVAKPGPRRVGNKLTVEYRWFTSARASAKCSPPKEASAENTRAGLPQ
jgi:hypothetical protein